jgi:PAS domain S-box-containing protein
LCLLCALCGPSAKNVTVNCASLTMTNELVFDDQLVAELFDAQPQPVFWMYPVWNDDHSRIIDFTYAYVNEEMYRYSGLSREQLLGSKLSETLTLNDDMKKKAFTEISQIYEDGIKQQQTFYNAKLNKYYTFLRSRVRGGILTILQDRSHEYEMIHELNRQKAVLDNILKHSPSGISITRYIRNGKGEIVDGITTLANEAACRFTGLPAEIYLSKTFNELDPGMFETEAHRMGMTALQTGEPFHTQYYFEKTGRWLEVAVARLDEDQLINVFTDVTSTKEAELELKQSADRLNSVFNTAQAGLFTIKPIWNEKAEIYDFRFGIVNQSVAAYIGQTAEILTGALASIYFPAYKTNGLFEIYKDTYLTGTPHQFDFHYEDGYDVFFNIQTVKTGEEVLVTFTDHTTLKRLQRELESTIVELKRSNSNLEEFAYAASHDLKEPIRKIHFFADRLKEGLETKLDAENKRLFDRMQVATERMRSLVDDLLMYSQVSLRPKLFDEVDLNKVLHYVLSDLELEIEEKNAQINIGILPTIRGHQRQLQQLFQNLLGNALKYTRSDIEPVIAIACGTVTGKETGLNLSPDEVHKSFHSITVTDNGIGFDQKDAERIFNVFQRLHGNSEYRGTGIGLSIARKVTENHNGHIIAEGKPGEGAVFTILLPVA